MLILLLLLQAPLLARLPSINLGGTNILDGGPLRPLPGWYWQEFLQGYWSDKVKDGCGVPAPCTRAEAWNLTSYLARQTKIHGRFGAFLGYGMSLPLILSAKLHTPRGTTSVHGVGDVRFDIYSQWRMKFRGDKIPLFVHRLDFGVGVPSGSYHPNRLINPGSGFWFLNPYWSATIFFNKHWAISWRINYLWNGRNPKNNIRSGQAFHGNFDISWSPMPHRWVAAVGYFLTQFTHDKLGNVEIPNSKERVFGFGPGFLYSARKHTHLFSYLYFETGARNRSQGTRFVFRFFQYF